MDMSRETVACCGLYCESCGVYIATMKDDVADLARIAARMGTTAEEMRCEGCRSATLSPHCRDCGIRACADGKGIDFCEACAEFPCARLEEFRAQAPHRAEIFESARYRKSRGLKAWEALMVSDYSCESCGSLNSPYYAACAKCGRTPPNRFAARHGFGKSPS